MRHTAEFERYRQLLREEMNKLSDDIVAGGPLPQEDYVRTVGEVRGLAMAERLLLDLVDEIEKRNNDE